MSRKLIILPQLPIRNYNELIARSIILIMLKLFILKLFILKLCEFKL